MASNAAKKQIKSDEGSKSKAYLDTEGILTIGVGFNLERSDAKEMLILAGVKESDTESIMKKGGKALTEAQIDALFDISLQGSDKDAKDLFTDLKKAPQTVQDVIYNMSFQLGKTGLRGFKELRANYTKQDWKGVKKEMEDSLWSTQTPARAKRLATQMGKVKVEPKTSVGKSVAAEELAKKELRSKRISEMLSLSSRQSMIDEMISNTPVINKTETTEIQK